MKTTNRNMTAHCRHGRIGICDYCIIAYGDHAERPNARSHRLSLPKRWCRVYRCAECKPAIR